MYVWAADMIFLNRWRREREREPEQRGDDEDESGSDGGGGVHEGGRGGVPGGDGAAAERDTDVHGGGAERVRVGVRGVGHPRGVRVVQLGPAHQPAALPPPPLRRLPRQRRPPPRPRPVPLLPVRQLLPLPPRRHLPLLLPTLTFNFAN